MQENLFEMPLKDPVMAFLVLLLIILIVPLVFRKLRVPSLIGLIIAGMLAGPYGFNILNRDSSIIVLGQAGLLYIMFLAGLDLDLVRLKTSKIPSISFGLLTFLIPLVSGFFICHNILQLNYVASVLVSSMFSTHTLVSYPIAARFGITKNPAVTMAIGGTIITDTLVLLLFSVLTGSVSQQTGLIFWIRLTLGSLMALFVIFFIIPRIARWFFRHAETEKVLQFIFVLAIVYVSAFMAKLSGIEPIIGAFLAGIVFNRIIPAGSALMGRIEFIGNALFIPVFLIGVGMLINPSVIFGGYLTVLFAGVLTIHALISKWFAAWFSQLIFRLSVLQRNVLFGLSSSHAAATLAIITIGYHREMISVEILNGTLILILVTCIISAYYTEKAGRKLALLQGSENIPKPGATGRTMITIANPNTAGRLLEIGMIIHNRELKQPLIGLAIVSDQENTDHKISESRAFLDSLRPMALARDMDYITAVRIDINPSDGIIRAAKEMIASDVIIGWPAQPHSSYHLFKDLHHSLLENLNQNIFFIRMAIPHPSVRKIWLIIPPEFESDPVFYTCSKKLTGIISGKQVVLLCTQNTAEKQKSKEVKSLISSVNKIQQYHSAGDLDAYIGNLKENDLALIVNTRRENIIYDKAYNQWVESVPVQFPDFNLILVYPEKNPETVSHNVIAAGEVVDTPFGLSYKRLLNLKNPSKQLISRNNVE